MGSARMGGGGTRGPIQVITVAYVASFTPDVSLGDDLLFDMSLTGNVSVQNVSLASDGKEFTLRFRDDGGGRTITFAGSAYRGSTDTPLSSVTLSANKTAYYAFKVNAVAGTIDFVAPNKGY